MQEQEEVARREGGILQSFQKQESWSTTPEPSHWLQKALEEGEGFSNEMIEQQKTREAENASGQSMYIWAIVQFFQKIISRNTTPGPSHWFQKTLEEVEGFSNEMIEQKKTREVEDTSDELMYNRGVVKFLQEQMQKAEDQGIPPDATPDSICLFERAWKQGKRLVRKHKPPFNLQTFYSSEEACECAQEICRGLNGCMHGWGLQRLQCKFPQNVVDEDRKLLSSNLRNVVEGKEWRDVSFKNEWKIVKQTYDSQWKEAQIVKSADIHRVREVAKGGFGIVHEGFWKGSPAAIKMPKCGEFSPEEFRNFYNEVCIHQALDHRNVVPLYGATKTFELLIVMQLAKTSLRSVCQQYALDWPIKLKLLQEAAAGLKYVHSKNLVHRDVKSENFLVFDMPPSMSTIVKITDFGLAVNATDKTKGTLRKGEGTWRWIAPEIYWGGIHTFASDVFSFGIVMYEVVTGRHPYGRDANNPTVMFLKLGGKEPCRVEPSDCPEEMLTLMTQCRQKHAPDRPCIKQICRRLATMPRVV